MKWILIALVAALALIAAGVVLTGGEGGGSATSASPEAVLLCEEGTADLNAFRLNEAVEKLGHALELDPTLAEASISRAFALSRLGRKDDTKAELQRADSLVALIQDDRRRMLAQLRLSAARTKRTRALRDSLLARLEQEIPENLYVLEARAMDIWPNGDPEEQERRWRHVLEVDPNHAVAYNQLGYLELKRGDYERAIEYMKKYAFLAPDLANPHDSLGEVLMVLGRYEEAEKEFRAAVRMQPDFYFSLINLGRVYLARGQLETGRKILDKVREQVTGSDFAKVIDRVMIRAFLDANLQDQLSAATAHYIADYPDDGMTCFYRGMRLAYRQEFQEATAVMDSCLGVWRTSDMYDENESHRREVELHDRTFEALVADAADEAATAVRLWRDVLVLSEDLKPFHEQWFERYRLAAALRASGEPREALAELEPILAVNPRLQNVLALTVACYADLGEAGPARRVLDQLQWCAGQADPDYPYRARAAELAARVAALEGDS